MTNNTAEPMVPVLKAVPGSAFEKTRTITIPKIDASKPSEARARGRAINPLSSNVAAIAIEAIMEPQYDSKISDPMPATSPTLSPTLSAITPGFLGSSSGIPASTLPTKSAPTSALLVYIPPPTLENNATHDAPIPKPSIALAVSGSPPK